MNLLRASRLAAGIAILGAGSVLLVGCPDKPAGPSELDGGPVASPDQTVDAGPPLAAELVLEVSGEIADAGTAAEIPVAAGARPEVPQLQAMTVATNLPLQDYRIRVFDETDRAVPSDDESEDLPNSVIYRIRFVEPLKTGYRYVLVVDAQTGPEITDKLGRGHPDVRLEFKIAGEKQKPPPPPKKKRRRR